MNKTLPFLHQESIVLMNEKQATEIQQVVHSTLFFSPDSTRLYSLNWIIIMEMTECFASFCTNKI